MTDDAKDLDREELAEEELDAVAGGLIMEAKLSQPSLTDFQAPITGIASVTNPEATTLSDETETDAELRPRRKRTLGS